MNFRSTWRDLGYAARSLKKARGFALVCILSLGIGMGGFIALVTFTRMITSPARGISTEGLAELLVLPQGPLLAKAGTWATEQWSYPDYQALRGADTGMALTGWTRDEIEFGSPVPGETDRPRVAVVYASANYFTTFGVTLARGAGFDPAVDDALNGDARVVLSHDFWQRQMSADPDVVGRSLLVGDTPHTVVGVAPENFHGHFHFFQSPGSSIFIPLERHPRFRTNPNLRNDRTVDWVHVHGRMNDGIDLTRAKGLVATAATALGQRYPSTNEFKQATVEPYYSMGAAGRPESRRVMSVLLGLAGSVLLIVCLNISGMMLVRGASRERELSIRSALGADRGSLIKHLFFEALVLAFVGAALSAFVLFGIPALAGWYIGFPVPEEVDFDLVSVALSSGLCLLVSVLFGLLPAVRFSKPNLLPSLKDDVGAGGGQTIRVHRIAAMVQIGIAVPFLVVAGVMMDRVRTADFGFPLEGLAGARLPAQASQGREADFAVRSVRDNLRQTAGVQSVAIADGMPVDFDYREFRVASTTGDTFVTAHVTHVGENFLEAVGARLMRGRTITAEDRLTDARVAVLSQPLADLLFPGKEPVGERVTVMLEESKQEEFTVVGVSNDFATSQLTTTRSQILLPLPEALPSSVHVIVRGAAGDEPKLRAALENSLKALGVEAQPGVAFPGVVIGPDLEEKSIGDLISESMAVAFAGVLVLVLAALGVIGVVSFMVATRTREFAVRMALGSTRLRIFRLMQTDIVKLVIPGVVGGLAIGAVFIRSMENVMGTPLTLGPDPLGIMEPVIYAGAAAIAIGVSLIAGFPAARRATTVQPMVAIRTE